MVGRLVEHEQGGLHEQRARQGDTHSPPAGEVLRGLDLFWVGLDWIGYVTLRYVSCGFFFFLLVSLRSVSFRLFRRTAEVARVALAFYMVRVVLVRLIFLSATESSSKEKPVCPMMPKKRRDKKKRKKKNKKRNSSAVSCNSSSSACHRYHANQNDFHTCIPCRTCMVSSNPSPNRIRLACASAPSPPDECSSSCT